MRFNRSNRAIADDSVVSYQALHFLLVMELSLGINEIWPYYINITFPDMVIVENIIPRNVIINRGAAEVDNHISRDDIFDYHYIREGNIYFIIPNIRSFIFHCLRPTMMRGDPKGK